MNYYRQFIAIGSFYGATAVGIGAFGAHGLKNILGSYELSLIETAMKYQMFHALALILTGLLLVDHNSKLIRATGFLFAFGIFIFSASLITLALTKVPAWGAVTPIGGLFLISAWSCLMVEFLRKKYY